MSAAAVAIAVVGAAFVACGWELANRALIAAGAAAGVLAVALAAWEAYGDHRSAR